VKSSATPPTASRYRERIFIRTSSLGSWRKALATGGFWRRKADIWSDTDVG